MQSPEVQRPAVEARGAAEPVQPPTDCPRCGTRYGTPLRVPLPQEARKPIVMEAYVCSRCGRLEFFDPRTGMATPTTSLFLGPPAETTVPVERRAAPPGPRIVPPRALGDGDELARTDATYVEGELRRRTIVRAAALAGIVVGAGLAAFAALEWPATTHISNQLPIGIGVYLVGICVLADWILGRSFRRQIQSVRTTPEGVQATLRDGRSLWARWRDPTFAVDCLARPRMDRSPPVSYLLLWPMDRGVTPGELSEPGRNWLLAAAKDHGIRVTEKGLGSGGSAMKLHELRSDAEGVKGRSESSRLVRPPASG